MSIKCKHIPKYPWTNTQTHTHTQTENRLDEKIGPHGFASTYTVHAQNTPTLKPLSQDLNSFRGMV